MEIKKEIIEPFKELSSQDRDDFAKKLADKFARWDEHRSTQIDTAREIMQEVYLNQPKKKPAEKELSWKSDVKMNALYNIKRTKKAALWHEMWSEPQQMFDVKGTNKETEQSAKEQKAALVDSLVKMNIGKQYDKSADDLYDIGEMIFKTDWEQRKKIVKRQKKDIGFILMNLFRNANGAGFGMTENMQDIELPYYENARVESISPFMFVFDHSRFKYADQAAWDSLIKIYKRFDTLENIKNNDAYTITKLQLAELEKENDNTKTTENKKLVDLRETNEYGDQYSILYAHGDFKIKGKLYKNYIAEVLAGKYLIRFEENPTYINPFIFCALEIDPLTKRGISPLKCVLPLCKKSEELTNTAMDVQNLKANPPMYADETFFDEENTPQDGKIALEPGKIIKIKNTYNGSMPQAVQVSGDGIGDLLNLSNQKISDLSSVSNFMYGNVTDTKRTATELSLVDKGASAQVSKELDTINQDLTIPMVKNVAELLAMFKDGVDYVYMQEKGQNVEYKITNQIRQAQYNYIYEDRNAIENRKSKFDQMLQMFNSIGENPELFNMINWRETITTAVEMLDFENPDKFLNGTSPAEQFCEQLKQIPPEFQAQVCGMFSQELQNMSQQYQAQQQQQEMQNEADKQVQMELMRDQARQNAENEILGQGGI